MARSRHRERIYIGVGGHLVAIDADSGDEVWRTKLKGSMFVTVCERGGRVYAGANGELFALDRDSGEIVWHNRLKGLGFRYLSVEHYIVFYKLAGHQLRVYRVLHARRDYWPLLR